MFWNLGLFKILFSISKGKVYLTMKLCVVGARDELSKYMNGNFTQFIDKIIDDSKVGQDYFGFEIFDIGIIKDVADNCVIAVSSDVEFNEVYNLVSRVRPELQCIHLYEAIMKMPKIGYCNICRKDVQFWGYMGQDNETVYKIIGNGKRLCGCPHCGAIDRERWVYYVMDNFTDIFCDKEIPYNILHFAPEKSIKNILTNKKNVNYLTADITGINVEYKVDMRSIPFEDRYFDCIIANHVLEHISDDARAINELFRCLKDNGQIVITFPITLDSNTIENSEYNTDYLRKKYYGQENHVRLYGKDYMERFEKRGFKTKTYIPKNSLNRGEIDNLKIIENDIVIILEKNSN